MKTLFFAGAAAYGAGQYLAAIQAFDSVYAVLPYPELTFSLAQAERSQYVVDHRPERLHRAIGLFRDYIEQTPRGERRLDAVDALSQLELLEATLQGSTVLAAAAQKRPEASTRLMVMSDAPGARIQLDDAAPSESPLVLEVAPGPHRVAVSAPGFGGATRDVVAVSGEIVPISMSLTKLPSELEVQVLTGAVKSLSGAAIYVDGSFASQTGPRGKVLLSLPEGSHEVVAAKAGYRLSTRALYLQRGHRQSVRFELDKSRQRVTSHWLLAGGIAAAIVGTAFGLLAEDEEEQAQAFLQERKVHNVDARAFDDYDDDVKRRDVFWGAAAVSFAAAIGLLGSSLILHETDAPKLENLQRVHIDVSLSGRDQLGASVRGAF